MKNQFYRNTKYLLLLLVIIYQSLFNLGSINADSNVVYEQDMKQVRSSLLKMQKGWNVSHGIDFASVYSENSLFINIFTMKLSGKEMIAKRHQEIFDGFLKNTRLDLKIDEIELISIDQNSYLDPKV